MAIGVRFAPGTVFEKQKKTVPSTTQGDAIARERSEMRVNVQRSLTELQSIKGRARFATLSRIVDAYQIEGQLELFREVLGDMIVSKPVVDGIKPSGYDLQDLKDLKAEADSAADQAAKMAANQNFWAGFMATLPPEQRLVAE